MQMTSGTSAKVVMTWLFGQPMQVVPKSLRVLVTVAGRTQAIDHADDHGRDIRGGKYIGIRKDCFL